MARRRPARSPSNSGDGCIALLGELVAVAAMLVELDEIEELVVAMLMVMLD
jgi:hypothetical protein